MNGLIFLNGYYHSDEDKLVRKFLKSLRSKPVLIAVDGGISFLQKIKLRPDYWISDMDSSPAIKKGFLTNVESIIFDNDKDKTDGELAVDLAIQIGIKNITIMGWYDLASETDHLLGNLMLGFNSKFLKSKLKFRFLGSRQEIFPVNNAKLIINNNKGKTVSIVPVSKKIMFSTTGTKYKEINSTSLRGQTLTLRNEISANKATVMIRGQALVIINN